MKISTNSLSLAGEFAVLSQLSLRGIDANLTLGNAKSVDILASDPESGKMYKIEVKTTYSKKPTKSKLFGTTYSWIMGEKHESIVDSTLYYCFVNIETKNSFRYFVVPSSIVANYVKKQHDFWLNRDNGKHKDVGETTMRKFRVGLEKGEYKIETPVAKNYEDNWEFFKE